MVFNVTTQKPVPLRYRLEVLNGGRALGIAVSKKTLKNAQAWLKHPNSNTYYGDPLNLGTFVQPSISAWGFESALEFDPTYNIPDFHRIVCEVPHLGGEYIQEPNNAHKRCAGIVASIAWLLACIERAPISPEACPETQLLEVSLCLGEQQTVTQHGISARLSSTACSWIERNVAGKSNAEIIEIPEISRNMAAAYLLMDSKGSLNGLENHEIKGTIHSPCCIHFEVPGDRAELGSRANIRTRHGEISDHNIATTIQTIVVLVGLATFHSIVRREGG